MPSGGGATSTRRTSRSTRPARCRTAPAFASLAEFRNALVAHPERFVRTVTERLLTYALGRGVSYFDGPAMRAIARETAANDYRFSSMVLGVVKSVPFQMRRSAPASASCLPLAISRGTRRFGDDGHEEVAAAPDVPAWHGRHAGAAAARRHGAGSVGHREDGRQSENPPRVLLRGERGHHAALDAEGRRCGPRAVADSEPARAGSGPDDRRERTRQLRGERQGGLRRSPHALSGGVADGRDAETHGSG